VSASVQGVVNFGPQILKLHQTINNKLRDAWLDQQHARELRAELHWRDKAGLSGHVIVENLKGLISKIERAIEIQKQYEH